MIEDNRNGFLCRPEVGSAVRKVEEIISKIPEEKLNEIILKEKRQTLTQRDLAANYFTPLYFLSE